jgi:hypothetical protein
MAPAHCWSAAACCSSGRDGALSNGGALCGPAAAGSGCARHGAISNIGSRQPQKSLHSCFLIDIFLFYNNDYNNLNYTIIKHYKTLYSLFLNV